MWAGSLDTYDDKYDRVSVRKPRSLQRQENRQFFYVTTTDDEVIEQMATQQQGNVFATDIILSTLMSATRSVFPWYVFFPFIFSCFCVLLSSFISTFMSASRLSCFPSSWVTTLTS